MQTIEDIHQGTKALAQHYELQTFSTELATELMGDIINNASAIHELEARLKVLKSRGRLLNGYIGQFPDELLAELGFRPL